MAASNSSSSPAILVFSKPLTTTDIEKKLSVPTKALKHLPSFGESRQVYIEAKDDKGYFWSFTCSIRRDRYSKPVLSSRTWLSFARYRNLRAGDIIKLYKEHDQFTGVEYKIEVEIKNQ
ncbi:hypothetical protein P3X46_013323 [Hevea brasiliensis]|uniref:TF-B3 domain-containing protein n=1 Tax=Hevea brasiliensis TaxID=3981 RepID=A0ABQ9M369_HEVBR|nr:hypothetical protein P3X46_013323 [Hevea brasiliensis]